MNKLYGYSVDNFMGQLPAALFDDPRMNALACSIAKTLVGRLEELTLAEIYTRIDELPESLLDILARDFSIDWYNYDYSVDVEGSQNADGDPVEVLFHDRILLCLCAVYGGLMAFILYF